MDPIEDDAVWPPEGDAPAELQQFSKQLNVYDPSETYRGRFLINNADQLEISYKAGSGAVLINGPFFYAHAGEEYKLGDEIYTLQGQVITERTRAIAAEDANRTGLVDEEKRARAAEVVLTTDLAAAVSAKNTSISILSGDIATEVDTRSQAVQGVVDALATEKAARIAADGVQSANSGSNATAISTEVGRAEGAEEVLRQAIGAESSSRTVLLGQLNESLSTETNRALAAEGAISADLSSEAKSRGDGDADQQAYTDTQVQQESTRASAAETALSSRIDNVLSNINPAAIDSFTEVVTALNAAGGSLTSAITAEQTARQSGMATLQAEVDAMKAMLLALQAGY